MSKQNSIASSGIDGDFSRSTFVRRIAKLGICSAIPAIVPNALAALALGDELPNQDQWRLCTNCRGLFYNGYRDAGRCVLTPNHVLDPASPNYQLTYDSPGPGQRDWRYCTKCKMLFYNGYSTRGVCVAGGSHAAAGYNFTLKFDNHASGEKTWRFCNKCEALFLEDHRKNHNCAAGGRHVAAGYNFLLEYETFTF